MEGNSSSDTIIECAGWGSTININASRVNLTDLGVHKGRYDGISIPSRDVHFHNITISRLNITKNDRGINASNVHDLKIQDCNISDNTWYGVAVKSSNRILLSGNDLYNNYYQIDLESSSECSIRSNNITKGKYGIRIGSDHANEIVGNEMRNTFYGIELHDVKGIIKDNRLENNPSRGIMFFDCRYDRIENMTISGSSSLVTVGANSDITFVNSSLNKGWFPISSNAYLTLVNTSFNKDRFQFTYDTSGVTVRWFVSIKVQNKTGSAVQNAQVMARNSTGDPIIFTAAKKSKKSYSTLFNIT